MKTTKTIEILKCDFCDANDNDDNIETCNMCGKDFCTEHGCQYNNATGYYNEKKEDEYSKIFLCNDCIKKFFQKAKRSGFINKKETQEIDSPGVFSPRDISEVPQYD
jgi:hypothetical protein